MSLFNHRDTEAQRKYKKENGVQVLSVGLVSVGLGPFL